MVSVMVDRKSARVTTRPIPIRSAAHFNATTHRRLPTLTGAMWAVAAEIDGAVVGVAIVGRPNARMARGNDGRRLEVLRCAVVEGARNACSALYGACSRSARAMGAEDMWTFTHSDESGHSLRAAGWVQVGITDGGEWDRNDRQRELAIDPLPKKKWAVPWGVLAKQYWRAA